MYQKFMSAHNLALAITNTWIIYETTSTNLMMMKTKQNDYVNSWCETVPVTLCVLPFYIYDTKKTKLLKQKETVTVRHTNLIYKNCPIVFNTCNDVSGTWQIGQSSINQAFSKMIHQINVQPSPWKKLNQAFSQFLSPNDHTCAQPSQWQNDWSSVQPNSEVKMMKQVSTNPLQNGKSSIQPSYGKLAKQVFNQAHSRWSVMCSPKPMAKCLIKFSNKLLTK